MSCSDQPFTVIVLAGDRGPGDSVAKYAAVKSKVFASIAGRMMVLRVLDSLGKSRETDDRILVGPVEKFLREEQDLAELIDSGLVQWLPPQESPSASAFSALQSLPADVPVLVATADHALLTPEIIDYFCKESRRSDCDLLAGVVNHQLISDAFPASRRTVTIFRDGGYCGCNLFAFLTPQARTAANFWRNVEKGRKTPLRIIKIMGWLTVLRYILGRLTLDQALQQLSRRMQLKVGVVKLPYAEAGIDVDKVEDFRLVESILKK
ncbi:MAG: nucleotidyltransferase family protein, partial [Deltaproteobacteria bacterium]|nr:nucleotidyltransferase family protein [Deltaproteobacteria bacterium]